MDDEVKMTRADFAEHRQQIRELFNAAKSAMNGLPYRDVVTIFERMDKFRSDFDEVNGVIDSCEFCEDPIFEGDKYAYDEENGFRLCEDCTLSDEPATPPTPDTGPEAPEAIQGEAGKGGWKVPEMRCSNCKWERYYQLTNKTLCLNLKNVAPNYKGEGEYREVSPYDTCEHHEPVADSSTASGTDGGESEQGGLRTEQTRPGDSDPDQVRPKEEAPVYSREMEKLS